jgi:hypothetical protein
VALGHEHNRTCLQPCAVELGRANVRRLTQEDREFAEVAGPTSFHLHNVFIPTAKHKVRHAAPVPGRRDLVPVCHSRQNGWIAKLD